jgi:hypothetical protein
LHPIQLSKSLTRAAGRAPNRAHEVAMPAANSRIEKDVFDD